MTEGERGDATALRDALKHTGISRIYGDGIQCPYLALDSEGLLSCLAYFNRSFMDSEEINFFRDTCRTFYCAAWDRLTDNEVLFAAELAGDWYYYSLLINNIELLCDMVKKYEIPGRLGEEEWAEYRSLLKHTVTLPD